VPGPEIVLGGAAILLTVLVLFIIFSFLFTSLVITTTLSKEGSNITACGLICWGIFGIQVCWEHGCGILHIRSLNRTLWSKTLPLKPSPPAPVLARKPARKGEIVWGSLLPEALQALGYLGRHLRVQALSADVVLGFPSSPMTGMVYGYVQAAKGILTPVSPVTLQMTPDFDRTVCDGRFSCSFEIRYPAILGFRLLRIGLRRPVRDIWFQRGFPS
jgi:hypothetical protein